MNNLIQDFNEIKSSVEQTASDFVSDIERLLESGNQTTDNILKTKTINQTNQQILFTRQQMFQSLVELNSYKQKIIYLLICVIILIFIAFGLVMYMRRGSAGSSVNAGRFNRLNRAWYDQWFTDIMIYCFYFFCIMWNNYKIQNTKYKMLEWDFKRCKKSILNNI